MIQIRRRWPILAATIAALTYGANHYKIAGIEHLRLEPRPQLTAAPVNPDANSGRIGWPMDFSQYGTQSASATSTNQFPAAQSRPAPVWNDMLTVGEKLAMWKENAAGRPLSTTDPSGKSPFAPTPNPAFPVSSPIPVPTGFAAPGITAATRPGLDGLDADASSPTVGSFPAIQNTSLPSIGPVASAPALLPTEALPDAGDFRPAIDFGIPESTRTARTIRIASFNTRSLGPAKLAKPHVVKRLVSMMRQYDIVALQEVQSSRDDLLPLIVDRLNQSGRSFDYVIGPRVGRAAPHDQFAVVFDTERVETDRYQLYTVDDPEDLVNYEPLVSWFRCKGVPKEEAFTFSLVNVRIDRNFADAERAVVPSLIDAIQNDGRGEDDWIVVGDFGGGADELTALDANSVRFAIRDIPTNVAGTKLLDTIFFSTRATDEFTGRAGVFDFLRKYNMSLERALEISNHLPVWAEFSIVEGAEPGRIAPANSNSIY